MTHSTTASGTPVVEMTVDEYQQFLEDEACSRLGMALAEFMKRYVAGKLDDSDPDVPLLAMWAGMGQNGHRVAA